MPLGVLFFLSLSCVFTMAQAQTPEVDAEKFLQAKSAEELWNLGSSSPDGSWLWQHPYEFQPDPDLGFRQTSSVTVRHIKKTPDRLIYDVRYTFDEFGRRIHPSQTPQNESRFIALTGCSYTYGNALNDDETLSYFMNEFSDTHYTYNYGIGASGTHMSLALAESDRFKKEIPQTSGTLIYVYINGHIQRTNAFMNELGWLKDSPCYEKHSDGHFQRNGSFASCSPLRTWLLETLNKWLTGTSFHRNFPDVGDHHIEKTCQLAAQMGESFLKQYPDGQFFVYLHPVDIHGDLRTRMKDCMDRKKIRYVQLNTGGIDRRTWEVPGDGHPNAQHNRMAAGMLVDYTRRLEEWASKGPRK